MQRLALAGAAAAAAFSILTGAAGASTFTIGNTTQPAGSTATACIQTGFYAQDSGPGATYVLPAGGQITQWRTDTDGATAGTPISLLALAPHDGLYTVEAIDNETIPNPAGGVATFTPAKPMMASDGDVLAIGGLGGAICLWTGGSTPLTGHMNIFGGLGTVPGYVVASIGGGPLGVNVGATVVATEDSAVTTTVQPASVSAGGLALLTSTVTNNGPATNPLTFRDVVPPGLKITKVLSPSGPCTAIGPVVTCTISALTSGQSAPVIIQVTPKAGKYTNSVSLTQPTGATDPATANNRASVKVSVAKGGPAKCVVSSLANVPLASAKKLLTALNCSVGKVTRASSSKVAKGSVIKTTPGSGSFPAGKSIAIVESSGPGKH